MIASSTPQHPVALLTIEGSVTLLAIAFSFALPRAGDRLFSRIESAFKPLSLRKGLSVFVVGASAFLLRLAILPLCPIPRPFVHDDFSYLLAADTFAHGRLANPTPAMWMYFESVHITMKPTYMSMYFPAPGLVLAAGQVLTGHPWFGLLFVTALMCAAVCWALQAWLPPTWALLGGFIVIMRLGLFSFWINTYTGGGSITALGGALVLGSLPRLMRGARLRYGVLLAIGIILLATSRPYEGLLLSLAVAFALARWIYKGKGTPPARVLIHRAALPLLLIFAAGVWLGYYNYRVNGSPFILPYKIDRQTYAVVPYFFWQHQRSAPVYHDAVMKNFYCGTELKIYQRIHSFHGYIIQTFFVKPVKGLLFFTGFLLLPPLIMSRRVIRDRRTRFLLLCLLLLMAGDLLETGFQTQYLSPFIIAFYGLGLQAMRHLRLWRPGDQPAGKTLVRLIVTLCVVLGGIRLYAQPLHIYFGKWPSEEWSNLWYGPGQFGAPRARVKAWLEHQPGKQLAIVRYTPGHDPVMEWVYNSADINSSRVIWARDLGPAQDLALIRYYKDRTAWLVQPDKTPVEVTHYPMQGTQASEPQNNTATPQR